MPNQKTEIKNGITIKYHADGKSVFAKGKIKNGKPDGYWEWYRKKWHQETLRLFQGWRNSW